MLIAYDAVLQQRILRLETPEATGREMTNGSAGVSVEQSDGKTWIWRLSGKISRKPGVHSQPTCQLRANLYQPPIRACVDLQLRGFWLLFRVFELLFFIQSADVT